MRYVLCNATLHGSYREKPNHVSPPVLQEINAFVNTSFPELRENLNIANSENVQSSEERNNKRKVFTSEQWIRYAKSLVLNGCLPGLLSRIRRIKEEWLSQMCITYSQLVSWSYAASEKQLKKKLKKPYSLIWEAYNLEKTTCFIKQ